MTARKMPRNRSRIFHIKHRYWMSNSWLGLRLARRLGFLWVDQDLNITKDGWVVRGHWPLIHKDGGIVPASILRREHKTQRTIRISDLYWSELKHVKRRGKRLYYSINEVFNQAKATGHRKLALEEKGDPRFETDEIQQQVKDARDIHGYDETSCMVMTLSNLGNWRRRFAAAGRVNLGPRVLLPRGPVSHDAADEFDYYRGPIHWKA
jgi:glycerophosphoryl diester phosphodiesterase